MDGFSVRYELKVSPYYTFTAILERDCVLPPLSFFSDNREVGSGSSTQRNEETSLKFDLH